MKKLYPLKQIAIIILFTLTSISCKKKKEPEVDSNGLPKATQTGAMVFACQVNGENWISKKSASSMFAVLGNDTVSVYGINDSAPNFIFESLTLTVNGTSISKAYKLNDPDQSYGRLISAKDCFSTTTRLGIAKSNDGEILFTKIDKATRIISGTFWCNIPTNKCGIIKITDGRFDLHF